MAPAARHRRGYHRQEYCNRLLPGARPARPLLRDKAGSFLEIPACLIVLHARFRVRTDERRWSLRGRVTHTRAHTHTYTFTHTIFELSPLHTIFELSHASPHPRFPARSSPLIPWLAVQSSMASGRRGEFAAARILSLGGGCRLFVPGKLRGYAFETISDSLQTVFRGRGGIHDTGDVHACQAQTHVLALIPIPTGGSVRILRHPQPRRTTAAMVCLWGIQYHVLDVVLV